MGKSRVRGSAWAAAAAAGLICMVAGGAEPPQAVVQILSVQPTQKGVAVSMPTAQEQEKCTVSGDPKAPAGQTVWVLRDGQGQILRRFVDTNGDKYPDILGYYKDGLEVYREVDTRAARKPDRFLWLNTGGSRIGISRAGNGVIDFWQSLSLEELSQEVVQAVAQQDWTRYSALLISDEDLHQIGVASAEAARIKKNLADARERFQKVLAKFNLNPGSKWLHLETGAPNRMLSENTGWKQDVLIHPQGMILCETAGKTEYLQLHDIVLVGETWKVMDVPTSLGTPLAAGGGLRNEAPEATAVEDGPLQKALKDLAELDAQAPQEQGAGVSPKLAAYHEKRAQLINRIAALCPEKDRENWYKQIIDSLAATVAASEPKETPALKNFRGYADQIAKQSPGSEVASYAVYRLINVEHNQALYQVKDHKDHVQVQTALVERLTNYIKSYPSGSDAPEAHYRLGETYEHLNKETEARQIYQALTQKYTESRQAARAAGAVRRLTSIGQTWQIGVNVSTLDGSSYNPALLQGRQVVVYYWATWCGSTATDFAKMKKLLDPMISRGQVVLVAVNLDDKAADAQAFLQKNSTNLPACMHLHSPGSYDSPAAMYYGLNIFPAMFLQDKKGKITSRTLDVESLEEELKK
jgi:TolA-binding protein